MLKRRRLTFLGAAKITWTHTAVYVNLVTFFLVTATFYHTTGRGWFEHHIGWVPNFPTFLAMLGGSLFTFSLLFVYRYDVPSALGWYFDQLCQFGDVYRADIDSLRADIKQLEGKLVKYAELKPEIYGNSSKEDSERLEMIGEERN